MPFAGIRLEIQFVLAAWMCTHASPHSHKPCPCQCKAAVNHSHFLRPSPLQKGKDSLLCPALALLAQPQLTLFLQTNKCPLPHRIWHKELCRNAPLFHRHEKHQRISRQKGTPCFWRRSAPSSQESNAQEAAMHQVVLFLFLFQDDPLQRCANGKVDFQEISASRESAEVYVLGTLVSGQFAP